MQEITQDKMDKLRARNHWILDVDDCLFDIDTGLHKILKGKITDYYNNNGVKLPGLRASFNHFAGIVKGSPQNITELKQEDLGDLFPPLVKALRETCKGNSFNVAINSFYGGEVEKILKPSPYLQQAFDNARNRGVSIFLYTNGPSSRDKNVDHHVQKVLRARGVNEETINYLRPRTYDLLLGLDRGGSKPMKSSMDSALEHFKINPQDALMVDDSVRNLLRTKDLGIAPVWSWTSDKEAEGRDILCARGLSAPRIRHTDQFLLELSKS